MAHQSIVKKSFDWIKIVPNKLRSLSQTLWGKLKNYWDIFQKKPRYEQILRAFAIFVFPLIVICVVIVGVLLPSWPLFEKIIATNGFWNFVTVMVSGPILFLVWKFRDENTAHQLENQRKDVNLKEFQKIAEWISGLHLVEDKVIEKTKYLDRSAGDNPSEQESSQTPKTDKSHETEISHEFGQSGKLRHIPSHSRQDGAVGLQVAAVYMLKPFYCGEHGDGFRKPALNLLTAAWLALFKQVEKMN